MTEKNDRDGIVLFDCPVAVHERSSRVTDQAIHVLTRQIHRRRLVVSLGPDFSFLLMSAKKKKKEEEKEQGTERRATATTTHSLTQK